MKRKLLYGILCLGLLTITGCGNTPTLKNGEEVTASIKGYKVSANDLYEELKSKTGASTLINMIDKYIADKEIKTTEEIEDAANENLEQIKSQYKQYGMDFNDALKQAGYKNEKELLSELITDEKKSKMVDKYIADNLTDEEIEEYYNTEITGELTAKHILIKPDTNDDMSDSEVAKAEQKAKEQAEEIIKKLDNGEDFEKLAKKYSDDEGTANEGGLLSNFTKSEVVNEFWKETENLKDGKYSSKPVKSEYGYHVILRVGQKEKPKLEDVKDTVVDALVEEKKKEDPNIETTAWAEIREEYKLKINDSELNKGYKELIKTNNNNSK